MQQNVDQESTKLHDFIEAKFPVHKRGYAKKKKKRNISLHAFDYEDQTPYHIYPSMQIFKKHVDLLLLSNFKNFHYVLIKDFN